MPIWGQQDESQKNLKSARYIIDNQCDIDFEVLMSEAVWDVSSLREEEVLYLENTKAQKLNIPFLGIVSRNESGEIYQLEITDPLMKYGKRQVRLDRRISTQTPEVEEKTTGYHINFAPEDIDQYLLNQLPIRPDSIKVSVAVVINDSDWSDVSLKYSSTSLKNRSFTRVMNVERSIQIKIVPFGWTSVNSVAPMIDWDRSFKVEHRYFITADLDIPYAVLEKRDGQYNIAVMDWGTSNRAPRKIDGAPQIKALPNPVINDVRFEISNVPEGSYTIKIKNILGEVKIQKMVQFTSSDIFPINIDVLRKGSYFYALEDDQGNILSTKRLIVLKP